MTVLIYPSHGFAPDVQDHIDVDEPVIHADDRETFEDNLSDADIVITNRWDHAWDGELDHIDLIQISSAGYDHLPVDTFHDHGVRVANASGVHAEPIAEHVFAYMLGLERRVLTSFQAQQRKEWLPWDDDSPGELAGKTLTVIGVGAIGREIAAKARTFGMTINGLDPDDTAADHVDERFSPSELEQAVSDADYIVLACPLNDATEGIIGQDAFTAMPDHATLVNIARGEIIEEQALLDALGDDMIGSAVLDVFHDEPLPEDSPLWERDDVIITPHIAGLTPRYGERLAALFHDNLEAFRGGDEMPTELS
ncbi:MAG: D-2-hydroxyacid dehydrogenase [Candidatus Nanohaloarchaea archaeon]|nr:D-2-hydroxyacid dehydrogenase [Candidatus Nanohaloarchaea archaeon]